MKQAFVFVLITWVSITAHADKIGHSPGQEEIPLPPRRPEFLESVPLPPQRPRQEELDRNGAREVPFQARVAIGSTRCPGVIMHPKARNTPVQVFVDQQAQTIKIISPDREKPVESIVSTGGGLKIPNGELKKVPYCARTPRKDRYIVSAITPEMFKGTGCTEEEIRSKSTVFSSYQSRTFTDKNGQPIPLVNAVRIAEGIFFHEVPSAYRGLLGQNVSGECVRLKPGTAKFLNAQIRKYGAIEVNITEPPVVERGKPQYCDNDMVAEATRRQADPTSPALVTGTEGVLGGEKSVLSLLGRIKPGYGPALSIGTLKR